MTGEKEISAQLLAFLQREVFAPEVCLTAESDLIAAGFDSMSLVRVLVFIEQTFGLWIPSSEINANTLRNVGTLSGLVSRLLHES